ncbi:MAG: ThiF family adenylyltransferase [Candidatus Kariarchaeaceae archaeon]
MSNNFFSDKFSKEERTRLDRQFRLPGWSQSALKDSTVLIAGIGGLGTEIAKNLAMAGVGTLILVDMDIIEHSNLNRQILFIDGDEGSSKAKIAAKMLKRINPHGEYLAYHSSLQELDPILYHKADLFISGLDSANARQELNRRAVHFGKPLVDGGTATYHGHVYSYTPGKNACLNCDPMREREQEDLAACTLVGIPRRRNHCLLKGQLYFESKYERLPDASKKNEVIMVLDYANNLVGEHFPNENAFKIDDVVKLIDHHDPAIITVNAIVASLQSQDVLRILHHLKNIKLGELPLKYTIYNGLTSSFYQFDKVKNDSCDTCSKEAPPVKIITVRKSMTLDMLLHLLKSKGFTYDPGFEPIIWRVDSLEMSELDLASTIDEVGLRPYETIMINGIEIPNHKASTFYLRLIF